MSQQQHLLADFALPINLITFCNLFLYSKEWYHKFLLESLHDKNIHIGVWSDCGTNEDNNNDKNDSKSKVREVKSDHPSKVTFPGLPSHAESIKIQKLIISPNNKSLQLLETNKFHGIPMADYFRVDTVWNVEEMSSSTSLSIATSSTSSLPPSSSSSSSITQTLESDVSIRIRISCEVVFQQSTWLKGTIESNTKSELLSVFNLWKDAALQTIGEHQQSLFILSSSNQKMEILSSSHSILQSSTSTTDIRFPPLFVLDENEGNGSYNVFSDTELVFFDCEEGNPSSGGHSAAEEDDDEAEEEAMDEEYTSLLQDVKLKQEKLRASYQSHPGHQHPFDKYLLSKRDIAVDRFSYIEEDEFDETAGDEDEEDNEVDDTSVEDGLLHTSNTLLSNATNRRRALKTKNSSDSNGEEKDNERTNNSNNKKKKKSKKKYSLPSSTIYRPLLTPAQIMELYGNNSNQSSSPTNRDKEKLSPPGARHLAGAIAEVLFVLVESTFWQIHRFWVYELKELYTVDPIEVFQRILFCFIPGSHSTLLVSPDLYGPTVAVFILPQILLLSMDSPHHGCPRSALLRDALVVSLSLWGGLSVFYRLFAFLVAPAIRIRHCLCLSGYSFYSWNVALLVSYALRVYFPYLQVPPKLGLILFSVPCAIAQGYVFWEYTPLSINPRHLPVSWRRIADQHSRISERVLWAIPKLLILIIVAVTHYQTLWYIARVFLPGQKHYCRLSALMNPANYADILTQKELREFTMKLLKKGVNHHAM